MTRKQMYEMMLHKMTHVAVMQKEIRELRIEIKRRDKLERERAK